MNQPVKGQDCVVKSQDIERRVRGGGFPQSKGDSSIDRMRSLMTVRLMKIANGYTVTETGTGDIYSYDTLNECFEHIVGYYLRMEHP